MKQQCHVPIPFPVVIPTLPRGITVSFPQELPGGAQWEQSPFSFGFIQGYFNKFLVNACCWMKLSPLLLRCVFVVLGLFRFV